MSTTYIALVILHIVAGATWFGGPLSLAGGLKRALAGDGAGFRIATTGAVRQATVAAIGALLTLATGLGLVFAVYGGFKGLPVRFHMALGLVIVGAALAWGAVRPTCTRLAAAAAGPGFAPESVRPAVKRLSMFIGIGHTLWLAALVLMYARV
ncbi:MAG: hypothetical protein R3F60_10610 [bacterium]